MVVEKKSGDFKAVEIHLPSWMYSKVALAVMVVVLIAGFIWMTPGLNTAVFGTNAKTGPPTEVKTAEALATKQNVNTGQETAILANTDLQAKLEADKKDPLSVSAQRIRNVLTPRGEILIPISAIPKEIKLYHQELNVYIVGLTMDSEGGMTGTFENRGTNTVYISELSFLLGRPDYATTGFGIYRMNEIPPGMENNYIKSGERKSFVTQKPTASASEMAKMVFISPPVVIDAKNNKYGI